MSVKEMSKAELLELLRYFGEKNVGKRGSMPRIMAVKEIYMEDIFTAAADLIESLAADNARLQQSFDASERERKEQHRILDEIFEGERLLEYADNPCC